MMNNKSKNLSIPFKIGDSAEFSKTVSETDVYMFAGVTGDFNKVHLNEAYMQTTDLQHRIAHGVLTFAIGATTETILLNEKKPQLMYVSYGYDKLRFIRPVYFGDTITATYTIINVDNEAMKSRAKLDIVNQKGEVVCVSEHILKFFPKMKE